MGWGLRLAIATTDIFHLSLSLALLLFLISFFFLSLSSLLFCSPLLPHFFITFNFEVITLSEFPLSNLGRCAPTWHAKHVKEEEKSSNIYQYKICLALMSGPSSPSPSSFFPVQRPNNSYQKIFQVFVSFFLQTLLDKKTLS